MYVTKPYEFIGFGAMYVTKPYEFMWFGAMWAPAVTREQETAADTTCLEGCRPTGPALRAESLGHGCLLR
jgi:hypothetical protein